MFYNQASNRAKTGILNRTVLFRAEQRDSYLRFYDEFYLDLSEQPRLTCDVTSKESQGS